MSATRSPASPSELMKLPIAARQLADQLGVVLGLVGVGVEAAVLDVVDPRAEPLLDQPADEAELAGEVRQAVRVDLLELAVDELAARPLRCSWRR